MEHGTQRVEALSDGVFAIAITLLIMDIKIAPPTEPAANFQLAHAIVRLWPQLFAYVLSFLMIGIYWANHHYLIRLFRRSDHTFSLLNVLFLMCISFVPFPTSVLGQFWTDPVQRQPAVTLYALGMLLPAAAWSLKWHYARHNFRLLDPRLDENFVQRLSLQYYVSILFYLVAFAVSFVSPAVSIFFTIALTMLYLRSPPKPVYRSETVE